MSPPSIIPDVVSGQTIRSLPRDAMVAEAARLMAEHDISSVLVVDRGAALAGIVTERDLVRRVVAVGRDAAHTRVEEIMTAAPTTLGADDSPFDALDRMRKHRVRHLPIVDGRGVVGVVSMRDLRQSIGRHLGRRRRTGLRGFFSALLGGARG